MGKKLFLLLLLLLIVPLFAIGQNSQAWDTIKAPSEYDNIYSRALYSDSLSSSFILFIKKEVKKHKHQFHTEHVYILEGEGEMLLGEKQLKVKRGDILFIPKNTTHSLKVTSKEAVKVLSVQSPYFDGKDRVLIE